MSDDPSAENQLRPISEPRSKTVGDVPETIRRRYYTDERGGPGLGFYVDAQIVTPAFRDRGRELRTLRTDPNAIRDMLEIAKHRGWRSIEVQGSREFRREAWLAGRAIGLEMSGFRPGERDLQELERREHAHAQRQSRAQDPVGRSPEATMRVVRSVVRERIADPTSQDRLLATAKARLARWLERSVEANRIVAGREAGRTPTRDRRSGR